MQETVIMGFLWYLVFVFSAVCHEASHALAAYLLGDPTARRVGLVTLNPAPHIQHEPFGMVIFPVITYAMGGWMMGWASSPYDPWWAREYPRRAAVMAVSGPAANVVLAVCAAALIRTGCALGYFEAPDYITFSHVTQAAGDSAAGGIGALLSICLSLNLLLFVFNLLPLPPLDGSAVLEMGLKGQALEAYRRLRSHPYATLVGILVAWHLCGPLYQPILRLAVNIIYPGVRYS
jgi:Zn-dependent protease